MILTLAFFQLAGSAVAADAMSLSYAAALQAAVANNPALIGARLDVDAAEGALMAARGVFDPTLAASASQNQFTSESTREFGDVLSEFDSTNWTASLNQTLPTGTNLDVSWSTSSNRFRYELRDTNIVVEQRDPVFESRMVTTLTQNILEGHRLASNLEGVRSAMRSRDIAEAGQRMIHQQTLADAASAYWNTRTQRKLANIAAMAIEAALEEQRVVHAKVEQGTLAPVERTRVDAAVVQARRESLRANDAARDAEDLLLLLIGEPPGTEVNLTSTPLEPTALALDTPAIEASAVEGSPELQMARIREQNAEMARMDARHRLLPELNVSASYSLVGYEPSSSDATKELLDGELPEWRLGTTLSVPLLGRADRGQFRVRAAEAAKARSERGQAERQLRSNVRAQVRAIHAASMEIQLAAANLDLALQTLEAERALTEAGRIIQKDLLESIAAVDDARTQLERSKGEYQLALIELERLKGTL